MQLATGKCDFFFKKGVNEREAGGKGLRKREGGREGGTGRGMRWRRQTALYR